MSSYKPKCRITGQVSRKYLCYFKIAFFLILDFKHMSSKDSGFCTPFIAYRQNFGHVFEHLTFLVE